MIKTCHLEESLQLIIATSVCLLSHCVALWCGTAGTKGARHHYIMYVFTHPYNLLFTIQEIYPQRKFTMSVRNFLNIASASLGV